MKTWYREIDFTFSYFSAYNMIDNTESTLTNFSEKSTLVSIKLWEFF